MNTLLPSGTASCKHTRSPRTLSAALALGSFLLTTSLSADTTVNLAPPTEDNNVNNSGSGQWYGDSQVRIGRRSNDGKNYDYVIPFQLPNLQGDIVKSAELTVSIPSGSYGAANLGNVDLYGSSLYSTSPAVSNSAYYVGASNPMNPDAVLLQDDFVITAAHVNGGYGPATSVDVSSHLMGLYNAGAQPGDYTFFILSLDVFPGNDYRYLVADTANGSPQPDLELVIGPASTIETVTSHTDDRVIRETGSGSWDGASEDRIGRRNNDGQNYAFVMPFALPDLQGGSVSGAELTVNFTGGSWDAANLGDVDLYGVTVTNSSPAVGSSTYYVDGSNPSNPDAVLIQDNFADTSNLVAGGYGSVVSADLSSFIQARYSAGAQPGDYVFLVLTLDQYPGNNYRYLVANTGNSSNKPTLELTIGATPPIPDGLFFDPVNGSLSGDGSYNDPWPGLQAALAGGKSIPSGESAWLMSGYHGDIQLSGHKAANTTVAALDGHSPTLKRLYLTNASNWTFDGLEISPEFTGNVDKPNLVHVHGSSSDITVKNCLMYSAVDASNWSAQDWLDYASKGVQIDGPNCHIENNTILNTSFSIVVRGMSPNTYVGYNTIDGFSGDGLRGLADNCVFEYNLVQNAKNVNGNHDDGFQSWTGDGSNNDGVVSGIVLRGNVFIGYTDGSDPLISEMQGIGCFDGFFEDWIVENNVVITDMWHGLSLYGAINCKIVNNTVIENPEVGYTHRPWIGIFDHKNGTPSSGNLVRNNLAQSITGATSNAGTVDNNIVTSNYTAHFVDYANFDVHLKSSSSAIDAGSSVEAPSLDFEGDTRDSNPDIGADEF